MTRTASRDADARLVRAAARRVTVTITAAVSALVLAVLAAALAIVFSQISPQQRLRPGRHETTVDIGGVDILAWGVILGVAAIISASTLALLVTRRAVAPLADALRRQRRFVADASHELRTPLAILDARLQMLQRSMSRDEEHRELVDELREDSRNVIAVVADLLDSVDTTLTGAVESVSVARVAEAAVLAMRMLGRDREVSVTLTQFDPDLAVDASEAGLHRSLVALLDNAIKHSPPGSTVAVSAGTVRGDVVIDVSDQGPGILGIEADRVFDRFARSSDAVDGGGNARTGFGIGLALVQDTVGRYDGTVSVSDTSAAGTVMTLRFPLPSRRARHRHSTRARSEQ